MRFFRGLALTFIGVLIVLLAVSNREAVQVYFFFNDKTIEMPLFVVFFFALVLGVLLSFLGIIFYKLRTTRQIMDRDRTIKNLRSEIIGLKADKSGLRKLDNLE